MEKNRRKTLSYANDHQNPSRANLLCIRLASLMHAALNEIHFENRNNNDLLYAQ